VAGLFVLAVSGFAVYRLNVAKGDLLRSLPCLGLGERLRYPGRFLDQDHTSTSLPIAESQNVPVVVCIFSRPCNFCDENTLLWNRLAEITRDRALVIGIVIGTVADVRDLREKANPEFDIFIPEDEQLFKKALRIKTSYSQTIMFLNKRVAWVHLGTLTAEDIALVIEKIKSTINAGTSND
jgi:hypothetical protein